MRFLTQSVPERIAATVREMWLLEDDGAFHAGLPKPYVELVVSLAGVHFWRPQVEAAEHRYDHAWLTPLQAGPRHARSDGRRVLIGARLQPWAAVSWFGGLPPGDGTPPPDLRSVLGPEADRLRAQLLAVASDSSRFDLLASWLCRQRALHAPMPDFGGLSGLRAVHLAARAGLSARTLRRRFAEDLGISPKQWLRLHRLDRLLRDTGLKDADEALAGIAHAHGFADQAHMTREVASLTGATPARLRRNPSEAPPHLLVRP